MANTVNKYTNIFGEEVSTASIVSDMIADLQTRVNAGESRLTDVNVGSELRNVLEVASNGIYRYLYEQDAIARNFFVKYATKGFLDELGEPIGVIRKGGNRANGQVIFRISSPLSVDYTIYAGTRILSNKTGNRYILQDSVTIKHGYTYAYGLVVAEGYGDDFNCVSGELTAFDTEQLLRKDITVTNEYGFDNGSYDEDDESYRRRILKAMRSGSFGSKDYYEANVESFNGVHDVEFVKPEHINAIKKNRHCVLNTNNQTVECNDCTAVCLVNAVGKGSPSAEILKMISDFLINQSNIVLGHEFHVQEAVSEPSYFKVSYYTEVGANVTNDDIVECLEALIYGGYYDGDISIYYDGVAIGGTLYKSQIIDALENIKGLHHVENISLLKWHEDLTVIPQLVKWINDNCIYGSDGSNFTYTDILDFPDTEDIQYQQHKTSYHSNAVWRNISTVADGQTQSRYELVADGYYFYKLKDNQVTGDNNIGETFLDEIGEDYWMWGQKNFESITPNIDSTIKLGYLSDKATEDYTITDKVYAVNLGSNIP